MSGKWETLAVAAVVSASLNANAMENNNIVNDDNSTKIETQGERLDSLVVDDMSVSWQAVQSREELAKEMKEDSKNAHAVVNELEDYKCSTSEKSAQKHGATYDVRVSKTIDNVNNTVSTTIVENVDGKNKDTYNFEYEREEFDTFKGYSKRVITAEVIETTNEKGEVETWERTDAEKRHIDPRAVSEYLGNDVVFEHEKISKEKHYYDEGECVKIEKHDEQKSPSYAKRFDEVKKTNKDGVEETILANAYRTENGQNVYVGAMKGEDEFSANRTEDGGKAYLSKKGDKATEVRMNANGEIRGKKDNSGEITELSARKSKRLFKKLGRLANRYIRKISDEKNVDEYVNSVPDVENNDRCLSEYFDNKVDMNEVNKIQEGRKDDYQERFENKSSISAEEVAIEKMAEFGGKEVVTDKVDDNAKEMSDAGKKLSEEMSNIHPQTKVNVSTNAMLMASIMEGR